MCTVDLGPDLTEMFTMWGTLSKLIDDDYISISTYILNGRETERKAERVRKRELVRERERQRER